MSFQAVYHPDVRKDLLRIDRKLQIRLEAAVSNRLLIAPQAYGRPLSANLFGYWKMRVGDFRVVFKVVRDEIWIFGIIHRKDVYSEIVKRLDWKP